MIDEEGATKHYLQGGQSEGRLYKRYCMILLYYVRSGKKLLHAIILSNLRQRSALNPIPGELCEEYLKAILPLAV